MQKFVLSVGLGFYFLFNFASQAPAAEICLTNLNKLSVQSQSTIDFSSVVPRRQLLFTFATDQVGGKGRSLSERQQWSEHPQITSLAVSPQGDDAVMSFASGETVFANSVGEPHLLFKTPGGPGSYAEFTILEATNLTFRDNHTFAFASTEDYGLDTIRTYRIGLFDLGRSAGAQITSVFRTGSPYFAIVENKLFTFRRYNELYSLSIDGRENWNLQRRSPQSFFEQAVAISPSARLIAAMGDQSDPKLFLGKTKGSRLTDQQISRELFGELVPFQLNWALKGFSFIDEDTLAFAIDTSRYDHASSKYISIQTKIITYSIRLKKILSRFWLPKNQWFEGFSSGGHYAMTLDHVPANLHKDYNFKGSPVHVFDITGESIAEVYQDQGGSDRYISGMQFSEKTRILWLPTQNGGLKRIQFAQP